MFLVLSLEQSNFFWDTYLSFLVLCTLLMVPFMWLHYNHFIPAPSMHNYIYSYTLMKCDFTVCLMMTNTNNAVCFHIHNHGPCSFCSSIIISNNNIFEDQKNLLMFTSIIKTPTMFDMCSLAFRWLTSSCITELSVTKISQSFNTFYGHTEIKWGAEYLFSSGIYQSVFKAVQMVKNAVMNDLYACVDFTVLVMP